MYNVKVHNFEDPPACTYLLDEILLSKHIEGDWKTESRSKRLRESLSKCCEE